LGVSTRMACSDVSIYPLVDTSRCVHKGHHPYSHLFCLNGGDQTLTVKGYVEHYNNIRLNSAIGYISPKDMLAGHQQEIQADRDRKLEAAREQRKVSFNLPGRVIITVPKPRPASSTENQRHRGCS
jgi:hypothetical protein